MRRLILKPDLFAANQWEPDKPAAIQIFFVHIHCGNLVVVIGRIIVNPLICVAAGSVYCDFIIPTANITAAALLFDRAKNVEKLADALHFSIAGEGMHLREGDSDKPGLG